MAKVIEFDNAVVEQRTNLVAHIAELYMEDRLEADIDKLPLLLKPKDATVDRCCVYKDRHMLRYRICAILGLDVETIEDIIDEKPLSYFVEMALKREIKDIQAPVLTIIKEACHQCSMQQMLITDACQNCIAKPCKTNCPKDAITHVNGRGVIDPAKCVKCGKCANVCPYHAIINIPIPCMAACPVGAITNKPNGDKVFDKNRCVSCAGCQRACPFGAVMARSQVIDTLKAIKQGKKVYACIAPAIAGHLPNKVELGQVVTAMKEVGFTGVCEVAWAADVCGIDEAHEYVERMNEKQPFMTTSCCPAYVNCATKVIPELYPFVSHTKSPMVYASMLAKETFGNDIISVFVGPCAAKRDEGIKDPNTDLVLTYDEVLGLFHAKHIQLEKCAKTPFDGLEGAREGRGFSVTGGLAATILSFGTPLITAEAEKGNKIEVHPVVINGLTQQAVKNLSTWAKAKKAPGNIIEVMTCEGGCVSGPGMPYHPPVAATKVKLLCKKTPHHKEGTESVAVPYEPPKK